MSQISPPMRIVLAVAVLFLAAYMTVLKPKDEEPAPAATPAVPAAEAGGQEASTGLGKAVEKAREVAGQKPATTQAAPSKPSQAAPAPKEKPADPALAKLPEWLQKSLDRKVVAILFTNDKAADDRRTRAALKDSYKAHGKVVSRAVPIKQISKYRPVAEGVDVQQSPTLMVIDRKRGAQALVGYSSVDTINQAIIDALLATDNPIKDVKFLQKVQAECRQISNKAIIGVTPGSTAAGYEKNLDAVITTMSASLGTISNTPAPARFRALKGQVTKYLRSEIAAGRQIKSTAIGGKTVDPIKVDQALRSNDGLQARTMLELNAVGVSACN